MAPAVLKRLSWSSSSDQPHLFAPPFNSSSSSTGAHTPPLNNTGPPSPSFSFPTTPSAQQPLSRPQIERTTLHRSLTSLSGLLVALDEYREMSMALGKALKKVAKCSKELSQGFGDKVECGARNEVVLSALLAANGMFEALAETDAKHAKVIQRQYEEVNEVVGRAFKKIAKEEKTFDDSLAALDFKVAKATASYEKSRPRTARQTTTMTEAAQAAAAHDKYITSLSTLSSSISILKTGYAEMAAERREKAVKEAARVLCSLAETAWKNRVEGTKKGGEKAGEVVARGVWCEVAMPDMSLLGEEEQSEEPSVARAVEASVEDQPQTSPQTISGLRGPRALPGTVYAAEQHQQQQSDFPTSSVPPLDPSLFAPSTDHPDSNTYEVQGVNALQPPNASTMPQASFPNASPISTRSLEFPPEPQPLPASPPIRPTPSCQPSFPHPVRQASPISFTHNSAPLPPLNQSQAEPEPASRPPFEHQVESSTSATDDILEIYNTPPVSSAPATSQSLPAPVAVTASELRRPTPRHGAAPDLTPTHPSTLERNDTTTSERNFVARMREKYAEEKELKREAEERERERSRAAGQTPVSANLARSSSRVANLAKRYSSPPSTTAPFDSGYSSPSPYGTLPTQRPVPVQTHRHSYSMQPPTNTNTGGTDPSRRSFENFSRPTEFGQRTTNSSSGTTTTKDYFSHRVGPSSSYGSPPLSLQPLPPTSGGGGARSPRPYTRQPLPSPPHPSICACEKCTQKKYGQAGTATTEGTLGRKKGLGEKIFGRK